MQEVSVKASQQSEYGMVRNEHDAWDLAQEGFLKAWRSIHQFEGRSSFYTWLYCIT